jgi:hypothetical protein
MARYAPAPCGISAPRGASHPACSSATAARATPEQIAAVLRAADAIEAEHRGLTWEDVRRIRASAASAVALAPELGVSDSLIRKVRRSELCNERAEPRNRNDVPRRVVVETLILVGPRISEFCGVSGHVDTAGGRRRIPRDATKTDAGERAVLLVPALRDRGAPRELPERASRARVPDAQRHGERPNNVRPRQPEANARARVLTAGAPVQGPISRTFARGGRTAAPRLSERPGSVAVRGRAARGSESGGDVACRRFGAERVDVQRIDRCDACELARQFLCEPEAVARSGRWAASGSTQPGSPRARSAIRSLRSNPSPA